MRRFFYLGDSRDFEQSPFDKNRKDALLIDYSLENFIKRNRQISFDLLFLSGKVGEEQILRWIRELEGESGIPPVILLETKKTPLSERIYQSGIISGVIESRDTSELIWQQVERVLSQLNSKSSPFESDPHSLGITGHSKAILTVKEQICKYGKQRDMPVLITGESGVGKELVARAIFEQGHGLHEPYIATQASASGANLLESDFFGVKKGAYTGSEERRGYIELAHGGVLFIDEIGTLSLAHQVALLRVLEEKAYRPLGSSESFVSDFRLVSATNESLHDLIEQGRFREDLFHRISTLIIKVPPLRERTEDIPQLARLFLGKKVSTTHFTSAALEKLISHHWPGNVRELKNTVLRALAESENADVIESRHIVLYKR